MEAAKFFAEPSIEQIPATCGGTCSCGTCHVHIGNDWLDKLPKIDYNTPEIDLLEYQKNYKSGKSRLGCQVKLTNEHNGIVIELLMMNFYKNVIEHKGKLLVRGILRRQRV
jgi:ferredoxin